MKSQLSQQHREDLDEARNDMYHFMPEVYDELVGLNQYVHRNNRQNEEY